MLPLKAVVHVASKNLTVSMAHLALFLLPLVPLAGCANDGVEGPMASSLSTATDADASLDSNQDSNSELAHHDGGDKDPIIAMTPTATDVTAHVAWERPSNFNPIGYSIYYGKHSLEEFSSEGASSQESGSEELYIEESVEEASSCSHGTAQAVAAPTATITGLEPNTQYFFAIRAFNENESESLCSNKIIAITPSVGS